MSFQIQVFQVEKMSLIIQYFFFLIFCFRKSLSSLQQYSHDFFIKLLQKEFSHFYFCHKNLIYLVDSFYFCRRFKYVLIFYLLFFLTNLGKLQQFFYYYLRKMDKNAVSKLSQKQSKNQESNLVQVFRCSCGQEYLSFSALYLHNKKKHNIFLKTSQKEAAFQKKIWCGKKIKKIYDFSEDIEVDMKKDHQKSAKDAKKDQKYDIKSQMVSQEVNQSCRKQNSIKKALNNFIIHAITYYSDFQSTWIKKICKELIECINENYQQILNSSEQFKDYCEVNESEIIPEILNYFVTSHLQKIDQKLLMENDIYKFLLLLSEWLYQNKYCSTFIIMNEDYQQNKI